MAAATTAKTSSVLFIISVNFSPLTTFMIKLMFFFKGLVSVHIVDQQNFCSPGGHGDKISRLCHISDGKGGSGLKGGF
jgi:hypothetical protein